MQKNNKELFRKESSNIWSFTQLRSTFDTEILDGVHNVFMQQSKKLLQRFSVASKADLSSV